MINHHSHKEFSDKGTAILIEQLIFSHFFRHSWPSCAYHRIPFWLPGGEHHQLHVGAQALLITCHVQQQWPPLPNKNSRKIEVRLSENKFSMVYPCLPPSLMIHHQFLLVVPWPCWRLDGHTPDGRLCSWNTPRSAGPSVPWMMGDDGGMIWMGDDILIYIYYYYYYLSI